MPNAIIKYKIPRITGFETTTTYNNMFDIIITNKDNGTNM